MWQQVGMAMTLTGTAGLATIGIMCNVDSIYAAALKSGAAIVQWLSTVIERLLMITAMIVLAIPIIAVLVLLCFLFKWLAGLLGTLAAVVVLLALLR